MSHCTRKDPSKPPVEWSLTADALEKIDKYISEGKFDDLDLIITSTEPKAIATAKPIEKHLGIKSEQMTEFDEVRRSSDFLPEEKFLEEKKKQLTDWDYTSKCFPESANQALARFKSSLEKLNQEYSNKKILIVSHGTVLSIYLAHIEGSKENVFEDWNSLPFCALLLV